MVWPILSSVLRTIYLLTMPLRQHYLGTGAGWFLIKHDDLLKNS
jgi:hypothetical protein